MSGERQVCPDETCYNYAGFVIRSLCAAGGAYFMQNDDKDGGLCIRDVRKFPILLAFAASLFFKQTSVWGKSSIVLSSLGEIASTASAFLLVVALFCEIEAYLERKKNEAFAESGASAPSDRTRISLRLRRLFEKMKTFFSRKKKNGEREAEKTHEATKAEEIEKSGEIKEETDLIEIRKTAFHNEERRKSARGKFELFISFLYVVLLFVTPFEQMRKMRGLRALPPFDGGIYNVGIMDAIWPLIFACIVEIYLKMRKNEGKHAADRTSYGLLKILSSVSLVYATAIVVKAVLAIDAVAVLPWVYYAATVYMIAAVAFNILIAFMKGDIHENFDYTLTPAFLRRGYKNRVLDSEEIRSRFSFKSLWTIKYTVRIIPGAALFLGAVLYLSTALYVVEPHQRAAVYRFGKLDETSIAGPGLHVKLPWPIDNAEIYDVDRIETMQIGYQSPDAKNFLWTLPHEGGENMLLLGNGNELAAVNMKICYKISDLFLYVKTCANPSDILSAAAYEAMTNRTLSTTMDNFLSIDRSSLSGSVADELSRFCDAEKLGLAVVQVVVESIHPPVAVADVYQKVVTAAVDKNTVIMRARVNATAKFIQADRQRKTDIDKARVAQFSRTSEARSEMAVYDAGFEAYKVHPASFRLTKYIDAFGTMVAQKKIYVFSPGTEKYLSRFVIGKTPALLYQNGD